MVDPRVDASGCPTRDALGARGRFGFIEVAVVVLFLVALGRAVRAAQIGWGNHLSDMHGFRTDADGADQLLPPARRAPPAV